MTAPCPAARHNWTGAANSRRIVGALVCQRTTDVRTLTPRISAGHLILVGSADDGSRRHMPLLRKETGPTGGPVRRCPDRS